MSDKIYLYGGGGHGKVVLDILRAAYGPEAVAGIFDDDLQKAGRLFYDSRILGPLENFEGTVSQLVIAIGSNPVRQSKAKLYEERVERYATLIHPSAEVSSSAIIGAGTVVMPGCHVNADARIGQHCIINTSAIVEHDCLVADFTHIAPGTVLTGMVKVGSLTLIGANCTVVPGKSIGNHCLIAAGSVVTTDIPDNVLARGNPARIIKEKK